MTLNAAQLAQRAGKITGSRIACLMTGDLVAIDRLYREMIGEEMPQDLSDVWPVRRGEATESLNLEWFERRNNCKLSRHGDVVVHPFLPWAAVTLDAWCDELECVVEAKDVGGREPIEVIIKRYQPQMQWIMECTGADQIALSVIIGGAEPVVEFINRDAEYAATMVERAALFMQHVRNRTPPVDLPAVPAPIDAVAIYDMTTDNQWGHYAGIWTDLRDSAEAHADAAKILKSLVPADAKKAHGHGVMITRNRAGNLSLREMRE